MSNAFTGSVFEKAFRKKTGIKDPNVKVYLAGWLGPFPNPHSMEIKACEFRKATRGKNKGDDIPVRGTTVRIVVPAEEMRAFGKKKS